MEWLRITSPTGVLATLCGVCAFFFWLEKATRWKFFEFVPPLAFIYLVPIALSNTHILPLKSPVYDTFKSLLLPVMLTLLLINVNIRSTYRVMGRGIGVMLIGSLGIMVGAVVGLLSVRNWLGPEAWKAYGSLSASWTGGTANLNAVSKMVDASGTEYGLAVIADSAIYSLWIPILLFSKRFAVSFARFTGADLDRVEKMDLAAQEQSDARPAPTTRDYLFMFCIALMMTWLADVLSTKLPVNEPILTAATWQVLLITTFGIALSFTPVSRIPGSQELGMAFVLLYMATMGATADLSSGAKQMLPFLIGAAIMVIVHGLFCMLGARIFQTDIHTAAVASAANVGGVAASSIVATYHRPSLVPAAILMALIGIAIGNYVGYATALLCRMVM